MPTIEQARGWYPHDDPVHGFGHIQRVHQVALRLGKQLDADLEILSAAALLHDASGANPGDGESRLRHEEASAIFAREILLAEGWPEERIAAVEYCIRSHRYRGDNPPETLEAQILFDADKLDVNGAFGTARTLGYALQAGQPFFAEPSPLFLETGEKESGEAHSAYHEYLFKLRHIRDRLYTIPGKEMAEQRHVLLENFFEQLAAEARGEI